MCVSFICVIYVVCICVIYVVSMCVIYVVCICGIYVVCICGIYMWYIYVSMCVYVCVAAPAGNNKIKKNIKKQLALPMGSKVSVKGKN